MCFRNPRDFADLTMGRSRLRNSANRTQLSGNRLRWAEVPPTKSAVEQPAHRHGKVGLRSPSFTPGTQTTKTKFCRGSLEMTHSQSANFSLLWWIDTRKRSGYLAWSVPQQGKISAAWGRPLIYSPSVETVKIFVFNFFYH